MDPVLLLALSLAGGAGVLGFGVAQLGRLFLREWRCTWQGHTLRLVAKQNRKELYFDGRRVAQKTTLSGSGCTLSAAIDGDPPIALTAVIVYPAGAARPIGRLYANGQWIGGEPRASLEVPPARAEAVPEPVDPRWPAARQLLGDLRASGDPRATEAATRIEEGLRHVLGRLDRLAAAREAHRALGGDDQRVDSARATLDVHVQEVVEALREFHLVALSGGPAPSLDRVEDLLGRVAAEAEVEGIPSARARAAAARQRQG